MEVCISEYLHNVRMIKTVSQSCDNENIVRKLSIIPQQQQPKLLKTKKNPQKSRMAPQSLQFEIYIKLKNMNKIFFNLFWTLSAAVP